MDIITLAGILVVRLPPAEELHYQIMGEGIKGFSREHRFHPKRRWRFDFADVRKMVAIEVEGGTWSNGRHVRGAGYESDCVKYNEAALMGWKVIRVTSTMVRDGRAIDFIKRSI